MIYGSRPARRRDALRNRAAIVRAASEAMTGRRTAVGMPEIARRAGVGQATLYRHFPDRGALTEAVIGYQLDRLAAFIRAKRDEPDGFRFMLDALLRTRIAMRPLVLLARRLEPAVRHRYERRIVALLTEPLRRAQDHGEVRGDLVPDDLHLLCTMVEAVLDAGDGPDAAGRSVDLALDGVFVRPRPAGAAS